MLWNQKGLQSGKRLFTLSMWSVRDRPGKESEMIDAEMVDCAKKAKFKMEFMAMMMAAGRYVEAQSAFNDAMDLMEAIIDGNEDDKEAA